MWRWLQRLGWAKTELLTDYSLIIVTMASYDDESLKRGMEKVRLFRGQFCPCFSFSGRFFRAASGLFRLRTRKNDYKNVKMCELARLVEGDRGIKTTLTHSHILVPGIICQDDVRSDGIHVLVDRYACNYCPLVVCLQSPRWIEGFSFSRTPNSSSAT